MNEGTRSWLLEQLPTLCCPRCGADLALRGDEIACSGCSQDFPVTHDIPQLFWPNDWSDERRDVTEVVRSFYEETPFPNYDDFDSIGSLQRKARQGLFARLLDEQVPPGARIIECGCGTGQLSNFLSIANRTVFGTDMCLNSLKMAQAFKEKQALARVHFLQMNLFRPVFKPESFDLVISNGVLHHTSDPFLAFQTIARLTRPGGYLLVGLYHRYGRLVTDLRRAIFNLTRDRFTSLDPNLREGGFRQAKWKAWFMDQYKNPHESKHTIGEVIGWLRNLGFQLVRSLPSSRPFQPVDEKTHLFQPEQPGNGLERSLVELGMIRGGSREGGFFIVIGRKPPAQKSV